VIFLEFNLHHLTLVSGLIGMDNVRTNLLSDLVALDVFIRDKPHFGAMRIMAEQESTPDQSPGDGFDEWLWEKRSFRKQAEAPGVVFPGDAIGEVERR
jgi:hypothetical protein